MNIRIVFKDYLNSLSIIGIVFFLSLSPLRALAVGDLGKTADAMCFASLSYTKPCKTPPSSSDLKFGGLGCICKDALEPVSGVCTGPFTCKATTYTGLGGGSSGIDTGLMQLGKALGPLLQQLLGGSKDGGGGDSGSGSSNTGCTSYYQTTIQTSDPCATYIPPISNSLSTSSTDASNALINALNGGTFTSAISDILSTTTPTNSTPSSNGSTTPKSQTLLIGPINNNIQTISASDSPKVLNLNGVSGSIHILNNASTFEASTENAQTKTETAVFYGANTFAGSGKALVAQWCHARPWSNNFLGKIIPGSFFDSLCQWQGFEVGIKTVAPVITHAVAPKPKPVLTQVHATSSIIVVTPTPIVGKVKIWAVPAAVSIGSRTNIYWSSQNVSSCTESSPDASFTEHSVTGGASTVPITSATVFTISCAQNDGTPVTAYTTVNIAL